jgi:hypothetical protein
MFGRKYLFIASCITVNKYKIIGIILGTCIETSIDYLNFSEIGILKTTNVLIVYKLSIQ